jgi:hypothetical protein
VLVDLVAAVSGGRQDFVGVLAQQRPSSPRVERRCRHLDRRPQRAQAAQRRMIDFHRHLAGDGLRRPQRFLVVENRTARHAGLFELADPVGDGVSAGLGLDQPRQIVAIGDALGVAGEPRVGDPLGVAEHLCHLLEVAIVGRADRDLAVRAPKRLVRRR